MASIMLFDVLNYYKISDFRCPLIGFGCFRHLNPNLSFVFKMSQYFSIKTRQWYYRSETMLFSRKGCKALVTESEWAETRPSFFTDHIVMLNTPVVLGDFVVSPAPTSPSWFSLLWKTDTTSSEGLRKNKKAVNELDEAIYWFSNIVSLHFRRREELSRVSLVHGEQEGKHLTQTNKQTNRVSWSSWPSERQSKRGTWSSTRGQE